MSVRLMTTVWQMDISASEKLVMLALADWSNDDGLCWPSMRQLAQKSGLSDRAIRAIIGRMADAGHLTREEIVGKGVKYLVHPGCQKSADRQSNDIGERDAAAYHYVYRLEKPSTGEFYIGLRSCECDPSSDPYMGSGIWPSNNRGQLKKVILSLADSRLEAAELEQALVAASLPNPLCRNKRAATPEARSPGSTFPRNETAQTPEGRSANTSVTINTPSEANASSGERATRLPEGWAPNPDDLANAEGLIGPDRAAAELDVFRDYWRAVPGAKGRKLDWPATYRNWIRRAAKEKPANDHNRPDARHTARLANYDAHWTGAEQAAGLMAARRNF